MTADQTMRLLYLLLLAAAVGGYFVAQGRQQLGQMARHAMLWGLIFVGLLAGWGLWNDISRDLAPRQSVMQSGAIEVPRRMDGHFYLTLKVNGTPIEFVVDTGATDVVLTREDARKVGLDLAALDYTGVASTANGVVRTAPARLETVVLGDVVDENLRVYVNEGAMEQSLLGMAYLRRFAHIEIAGDTLILTR